MSGLLTAPQCETLASLVSCWKAVVRQAGSSEAGRGGGYGGVYSVYSCTLAGAVAGQVSERERAARGAGRQ